MIMKREIITYKPIFPTANLYQIDFPDEYPFMVIDKNIVTHSIKERFLQTRLLTPSVLDSHSRAVATSTSSSIILQEHLNSNTVSITSQSLFQFLGATCRRELYEL